MCFSRLYLELVALLIVLALLLRVSRQGEVSWDLGGLSQGEASVPSIMSVGEQARLIGCQHWGFSGPGHQARASKLSTSLERF